MRILYICDKLITFILNEIIELNEKGHDVFILAEDAQRTHDVINNPMLTENGLGKNHYTFCRFKNRKQKYYYFIKKLIRDFIVHPICTIKACIYMLKDYSHPKYGIVDYLNVRSFFGAEIDVIHSPFSTPGVIGKVFLLSKILNVPYTLCFRAHDIYVGSNFRESIKRIDDIKKASRIITIADHNRKHMKTMIDIDKDIDVIHSSLNVELFKPENVERSHKSIVAVCRLSEEKGINYLIEACHILKRREVDYECTVIGQGPEKDEYEKLVSELKVPNLHFTGLLAYSEVKEYLNRSTVFVLPSIAISSGLQDVLANSLKEAMAMRVPVITSRVHAIEELVEDGINGIIVPQKDPEAIADAIEKIFKNPDLRAQMGEEGRKKIERKFNTRIEVGKLEEIFKQTVNHNGKIHHRICESKH